MEPALVSTLLAGLYFREVPAWMIKELAPEDLEAFLERLRLALAKIGLPDS